MARILPIIVLAFGLSGCVIDSSMQPSKKSLSEVQAFLKPGMTTDDLQHFVKTAPTMVSPSRFYWDLSDGKLWTDFSQTPDGQWVITGVVSEPAHSAENAAPPTTAESRPNFDPLQFTQTRCENLPLFKTFGDFIHVCRDQKVYIYLQPDDIFRRNTQILDTYPKFYRPTWAELFDLVARQVWCSWSWDSNARQFKFETSDARPLFEVTLAPGWRTQDRGLYTWYAPAGQDFGMDIYCFGHFSDPTDFHDVADKVRDYFATENTEDWTNHPNRSQMTLNRVAGTDALYFECPTPRPGAVWRQWTFLSGGYAFRIVSAMPQQREAELLPGVQKMVASFKFRLPTASTAPQPTK